MQVEYFDAIIRNAKNVDIEERKAADAEIMSAIDRYEVNALICFDSP